MSLRPRRSRAIPRAFLFLPLLAAFFFFSGCKHEGALKLPAGQSALDFGKVLVGDVKGGQSAAWTNRGKQAVELDGVATTNAAFPPPSLPAGISEVARNATVSIPFTFAPTAKGEATGESNFFAAAWSTLSPKSDRPEIDRAQLKGKGVGELEEGGTVGVSGGAHDDSTVEYGEVFIGTTSGPTPFAIVNRGPNDIQVSVRWINNTGNVFAVTDPNTPVFLIKKNEGKNVMHTFTPAEEREYAATLIFTDAANPANRCGVLVTGKGKKGQ